MEAPDNVAEFKDRAYMGLAQSEKQLRITRNKSSPIDTKETIGLQSNVGNM